MIGLGRADRDPRLLGLDAVLVALLLAYVGTRAWIWVTGQPLGGPGLLAYVVWFLLVGGTVAARWKLTRDDAAS